MPLAPPFTQANAGENARKATIAREANRLNRLMASLPERATGRAIVQVNKVLTWMEKEKDKAEMFFWDDANNPQGHVLAKLEKPEIIFINSIGMMVKGYEPDGVDRAGRRKFKYQEWFVAFLDSKK